MTKQTQKNYLTNLLVIIGFYVLLVGLSLAGFFSSYTSGIMTLIFVNILLAVSLNLTTGCLGQIALGHAGFMSIGAYTAALFTRFLDLSGLGAYVGYLGGLVLGGILAGLIGLLVGLPALRLRGDYLAIITLAFGEIIRVSIENLAFTGGAMGLTGIARLSTIPMAGAICIIGVSLMILLIRSRHGRAMLAIREDDIASEASGIYNTYYRTLAFTVAAFFAGVAGGVYAHSIGVLGAKQFDFNKSIEILIIVVLGGLGGMTGSIITAIILTLLPELLQDFAQYRILIYAVALVLTMLLKPSGIFGRYEFSLSRATLYWKDVFAGRRKPFSPSHHNHPSDQSPKGGAS